MPCTETIAITTGSTTNITIVSGLGEKWFERTVTVASPTSVITDEKLKYDIEMFISLNGQAIDYATVGIVHTTASADGTLDFSGYESGTYTGTIKFRYKVTQ